MNNKEVNYNKLKGEESENGSSIDWETFYKSSKKRPVNKVDFAKRSTSSDYFFHKQMLSNNNDQE